MRQMFCIYMLATIGLFACSASDPIPQAENVEKVESELHPCQLDPNRPDCSCADVDCSYPNPDLAACFVSSCRYGSCKHVRRNGAIVCDGQCCIAPAHGIPICGSGFCDFKCNEGFQKSELRCVPKPTTP